VGATETIAEFIAGTSAAGFPEGSVEKTKKAIVDTLAAVVAGAGSEVAEPFDKFLEGSFAPGDVPVLGTNIRTSPETAALITGTLGAALDYDDVLSMMPAHPSSIILAAILSASHGRRLSGRDLIEAYVIGLEVGSKIGLGITIGHYGRGFHSTGTLGMFSALAALCKLQRLDVEEICTAFGIASSMASGVRRNFGTMTKPLHSGLAARNAVTAVQLASSGFTAALNTLEAPAGFFATYGVPESDADRAAATLGNPFAIVDPGLALKKFPCCYASHRAMDGVLSLRSRLAFDAASVERVVCRMPPGGMQVLTYPRPETGLEAKFSLQYVLAAAVLDGGFSLSSFSDDAVRRPEIAALYERIDAAEDPRSRSEGDEARSSGSRGFVEVEVRLRDGRSQTIRVDEAPGAPSREVTWDDLREKLSDCARENGALGPATADNVFAAVRNLDDVEDVHTIFADLLARQG
jgi:2-methylcitrate dehydratase PrpD